MHYRRTTWDGWLVPHSGWLLRRVLAKARTEPVVFPADLDKERMLGIAKQAERRFGIRVSHASSCPRTSIWSSRRVRRSFARADWIKSVYARDFNLRNQRFGRLAAERFSCLVIDSEERLAAACA